MINNFIVKISKLFESPIKSAFFLFFLISAIVIAFTGFWDSLSTRIFPNMVWGLYNSAFFQNVLVEAHGMLLDLLVIGVIVLYIDNRRDKKSRIERYQEEIDDFRFWWSEESAYKIIGNVNRLQAISITKIDLSNCFLEKMKLKSLDLSYSNLRGAKLNDANMRSICLYRAKIEGGIFTNVNLRGANLEEVRADRLNCQSGNLSGISLRKASLTRSNFKNSNLRSSDFRGANLSEAVFENADLRAANFKGAINLTANQLMASKSTKDIKVDNDLHLIIFGEEVANAN